MLYLLITDKKTGKQSLKKISYELENCSIDAFDDERIQTIFKIYCDGSGSRLKKNDKKMIDFLISTGKQPSFYDEAIKDLFAKK